MFIRKTVPISARARIANARNAERDALRTCLPGRHILVHGARFKLQIPLNHRNSLNVRLVYHGLKPEYAGQLDLKERPQILCMLGVGIQVEQGIDQQAVHLVVLFFHLQQRLCTSSTMRIPDHQFIQLGTDP